MVEITIAIAGKAKRPIPTTTTIINSMTTNPMRRLVTHRDRTVSISARTRRALPRAEVGLVKVLMVLVVLATTTCANYHPLTGDEWGDYP